MFDTSFLTLILNSFSFKITKARIKIEKLEGKLLNFAFNHNIFNGVKCKSFF